MVESGSIEGNVFEGCFVNTKRHDRSEGNLLVVAMGMNARRKVNATYDYFYEEPIDNGEGNLSTEGVRGIKGTYWL